MLLFAALLGAVLSSSPASAQKKDVNYDENLVGEYTLEDPLTFVDGRKVRNLSDWELRRAEILGIFQKEMYGRMPEASPIFTELLEEGETIAGYGHRRQVRMWFREDHTGPHIDWLIVTPNHVKGPVPSVMLLNYQGNHTILPDPEIVVTDGWLRNDEIYNVTDHHASELARGKYAGPETIRSTYPVNMIIARGYAFITACYADISHDPDAKNIADVRQREAFAYQGGVYDLWGPVDLSATDNTTALTAWGWALMRGMDMIEADPMLDARRVVLTGSSRLAKAALVAGSYDERFPVVVLNQTGGGGVPLAKRNYGENVTTEINAFPHWFCRAYDKYAGHEKEMPFDQHLIISCVAPRALMIQGFGSGWFDTKGEFLSVQAASPVWKKLGRGGLPKGLEWPVEEYDTRAIGDHLAYVRRNNEHGISYIDWMWMLDFADKNFAE